MIMRIIIRLALESFCQHAVLSARTLNTRFQRLVMDFSVTQFTLGPKKEEEDNSNKWRWRRKICEQPPQGSWFR